MFKKIMSLLITTSMVSMLLAWPFGASAAGSGATAGIVSVSYGSLNVRSTNSTSSSVVAMLPKDSYVTLLSNSGSWLKVEYAAGKYGYCSANYIRPVSGSYAAYVAVSTGSLNVRSGAGAGYSILTSLAKGTGLVVMSQSNGWSRILYNGTKTGYVSSSYIRTYTTTQSVTYPAIGLSIPNFKQTDSRWSSTRIGTIGKTIATSGCLTTALAMSESYRTGTTIYPNVMASKLTYMADATLYWPSNYVFSTDSNYLSTLYARLKAGKTTLLGSKNSYGSQHWVVVTGYTGGNTLTTSSFTVNDPGSSTRTTLQQHLNYYPTFYKLAFYP